MAEALAAVGVAASLLQLIDFGSKVLIRLNDFRSRAGTVPRSLAALAADLPLLLHTFKGIEDEVLMRNVGLDSQAPLRVVVTECQNLIEMLDSILTKTLPLTEDSKWRRGRKAVASLLQDDEIQKIQKSLHRHLQTLSFHHIVSPKNLVQAMTSEDFNLPFILDGVPVVKQFVGRDEELASLKEGLSPMKEPGKTRRVILIMHGLGGMGKTQLAVEYSRRWHAHYSAVCWLNGRTEQSLQTSLSSLAERIARTRLPKQPIKVSSLEESVNFALNWLNQPSNLNWLLIYDNVDQDQSLHGSDPEKYELSRYLPAADHGFILITTRKLRLAQLGRSLKVGKVNELQSRLMLESRMGYTISTTLEEDSSLKLLRLLDGLPLAIAQAGSYIRETQCSIVEYLQSYNENWVDLMKTVDENEEILTDYKNGSVWTTWTVSYKRIQKVDAAAANLLRLWAFLGPKDFWFNIIMSWKNFTREDKPEWIRELSIRTKFTKTMGVLVAYSLAEREIDADGYSIHPVVHYWVRHALRGESISSLGHLACQLIAENIPCESDREYVRMQRRLLPHVEQCSEWIFKAVHEKPEAISLSNLIPFFEVGVFYVDLGMPDKGKDLLQLVLNLSTKLQGRTGDISLRAICNLGIVYQNQGQRQDAERLYLEVLDNTVPLDTYYYTKQNLGVLYLAENRVEEALEACQAAFDEMQVSLGPDDPTTVRALQSLGAVYLHQGDFAKAEATYHKCLVKYESSLGPLHPYSYNMVEKLGDLLAMQNNPPKAEEIYQKLHASREINCKPGEKDWVRKSIPLATFLSKQCRFEETEILCNSILAASHEAAYNGKALYNIKNTLGHVYRERGEFEKASAMFDSVRRDAETALGAEDFVVAVGWNNLGTVLGVQGRTAEAIQLYEKAAKNLQGVADSDQATARDILRNLANTYKEHGRLNESALLMKDIMVREEADKGLRHSRAQAAILRYVDILSDTGRLDQVVEFWDREIPRFEMVLGRDHEFVLDAAATRASAFFNQRDLSKTRNAYESVLSAQEAARGKINALYARCLYNLALTYEDLGDPAKARELYEESLSIRIEVLGWKHDQTACTAWNLGLLAETRGDWGQALLSLEKAVEVRRELLGPDDARTQVWMRYVSRFEEKQRAGFISPFDPDRTSQVDIS